MLNLVPGAIFSPRAEERKKGTGFIAGRVVGGVAATCKNPASGPGLRGKGSLDCWVEGRPQLQTGCVTVDGFWQIAGMGHSLGLHLSEQQPQGLCLWVLEQPYCSSPSAVTGEGQLQAGQGHPPGIQRPRPQAPNSSQSPESHLILGGHLLSPENLRRAPLVVVKEHSASGSADRTPGLRAVGCIRRPRTRSSWEAGRTWALWVCSLRSSAASSGVSSERCLSGRVGLRFWSLCSSA